MISTIVYYALTPFSYINSILYSNYSPTCAALIFTILRRTRICLISGELARSIDKLLVVATTIDSLISRNNG